MRPRPLIYCFKLLLLFLLRVAKGWYLFARGYRIGPRREARQRKIDFQPPTGRIFISSFFFFSDRKELVLTGLVDFIGLKKVPQL